MRRRTGRWLLIVLGLAVVAPAVPAGRWILVERRWFRESFENLEGSGRMLDTIGVQRTWRIGGEEIDTRSWFVDTGFLYQVHGAEPGMVSWLPDGNVWLQVSQTGPRLFVVVTSPPWRDGVTDQTTPSAPWLEAGVTADEWWAEVSP